MIDGAAQFNRMFGRGGEATMNGLRGREALWTAIQSLPDLRPLATLACRREGFTDLERGAGVAYHHEIERLAELDNMAEGDNIPAGHVQVFTGWGPPSGSEIIVPEHEYLATLASVLAYSGLEAESGQVQALLG